MLMLWATFINQYTHVHCTAFFCFLLFLYDKFYLLFNAVITDRVLCFIQAISFAQAHFTSCQDCTVSQPLEAQAIS